MTLNSSHNLDVSSLVTNLQQVVGKAQSKTGFSKYAQYSSIEDLEEKKLEWEIDGYSVEVSPENSVVYCQETVEVPVRNIPNFNEIKRHGSLIYETTETINGKRTPVLWDLRQREDKDLVLVQRKVQASSQGRYSKIRLAGSDLHSFLEYCPIAKQINIMKKDDDFYLDKNIDCNRLQQDIISAGFDVILIKED